MKSKLKGAHDSTVSGNMKSKINANPNKNRQGSQD